MFEFLKDVNVPQCYLMLPLTSIKVRKQAKKSKNLHFFQDFLQFLSVLLPQFTHRQAIGFLNEPLHRQTCLDGNGIGFDELCLKQRRKLCIELLSLSHLST